MFAAKYNASGNDFVIFHGFLPGDRSELAIKLCDRHSGIGADGMVVLLPNSEYDFMWEFYNSDGSAAGMCGNATRAAAHYAYSNGLCSNRCRFLTGAGVIKASIKDDFVISDLTEPRVLEQNIQAGGRSWQLLDTGVPHLVGFADDISDFDLSLAKTLRRQYNANVNIYTLKAGDLYVRTFERGVEDETQACGTGIAASFLHAREGGRCGDRVKAYPLSGEELSVEQSGKTLRFGGKVTNSFNTFV
jgi:diaminopimelate epimerase